MDNLLHSILSLPSQMLFYLLAVVGVALVGGLAPALAAAVAAAALPAYYIISPDNFAVADLNDVVALIAFVLVASAVSSVVGLAARRAREAETLAAANAVTREELRVLADEQAALRRVATLVAHGMPPGDVFAAVAQEVGSVLGADATTIPASIQTARRPSSPTSATFPTRWWGVVAFGEAEARETVNPQFGQIAKVSSSKTAATRRVAASSTPSW
jgi:K+-sensing histidine kinase KdpD